MSRTTEAGGEPFRAGGGIGSAKPAGQIDHQKDLVEHWPKPGYPDAFQPIHKTKAHHPHCPGNIEHIGGIAQPEHIPGKGFPAQQVIDLIATGFLPKCPTDHDHGDQVSNEDGKIR
jgi:hypothetical protein